MVSDDILQRARNSFRQSIFEVMEKMYFVFLEPASGMEDKGMYGVEVEFSGPWEGRIMMLFSPELINLMISNLLGLDEKGIDDKIKGDTAKECVNMVAGSFLRKFEPDKALNLSIPVYLGMKYFKPPEGQVSFIMEAERGRMCAFLSLKSAS